MGFRPRKIFDKKLWVNLGKTTLVTVGMAAVVSVAAAALSPFGAAGIVVGTVLVAPFLYWFHFKRGQTHELAIETGADVFDRVCGIRHSVPDDWQNVRPVYAHVWRANYREAAR